ncbi:hypothetical protein DPMN_088085 [Dreissena polymorpha]|uniref:Uncharacterized protein n=1 Tax=Dreissena polymorpha TaxID=45954 RepID=A0A9D4KTW5_DREPO|nr:hypothetical protein DPMN_088085 [Dreissena polymorpha]
MLENDSKQPGGIEFNANCDSGLKNFSKTPSTGSTPDTDLSEFLTAFYAIQLNK